MVQITLMALEARKTGILREISVSSTAINVISGILILILSNLENSRSLRPSISLCSYFFLTICFDAVRTRTLWLSSLTTDDLIISRVTTTGLVLKVLIALLESWHKSRLPTAETKQRSPEETTGIYGLGAYVWLNKLFLLGYRKNLAIKDLYPLDSKMYAEHLGERLFNTIRESKYQGKKFELIIDVAKSLSAAFLIPIVPRVAMICFSFSQPFLINSILSYLEQASPDRASNVAYGLIGATALIYFGLAFSTALYWYFHERSIWMVRGALGSAIYKKTVSLPSLGFVFAVF